MKLRSTDQLLTLGMALTGDKRSMERRVRGVFARKKSAKGVLILSLILALALGVAAFTTACQPGKETSLLTPIPVEQEASANEEPQQSEPIQFDQDLADIQLATAKGLLGSAANVSLGNTATQTHITQPAETLEAGIQLVVDADVFVPKTDGVSIQECTRDAFTKEEVETMIEAFMPDAKWTTTTDTAAVSGDGTLDYSKLDLEAYTELHASQNGTEFAVSLSDNAHQFAFFRGNGIIYDENFLLGDAEMEREFGEIIRAPITLTRETAQAEADAMLSRFGAGDWALEYAERACMFDLNNTNGMLSSGWMFEYGLYNAGLSMRPDKGYEQSDRLSYWKVNDGALTIYVDESGISYFHWDKRYEPSGVSNPAAAIISVEDAIQLAKTRITNLYGALRYENTRIEVYDIRLATVLIGYNDQLIGKPFPEVYEDITLLIPTWNVSFRVLNQNGEADYVLMPFCAIDGGAVSLMEQ